MLSPFEWCVATSFYQRSANHVSFYLLFNLRNLFYLIGVAVKLPAATGPAPAAAGRRRHVLQDVEALAKALIVYDFALAQEEQRLDDLLVVRHVHQVLVGRARLLFGNGDV